MKNILDFSPSCRAKSPSEFCGPCPNCGGIDRFIIWPQRGNGGRYHCRQCGVGGDAIDYLRNFMGMNYSDACKALEIAPSDKRGVHHSTTSQVRPTRSREAQSELPPKKWTTAATSLLADCQAELLRSTEAAKVVHAERFIGQNAAIEAGLGWNERDRYFTRKNWGLPLLQGREKIIVPRGLVIATKRNGQVIGLTIRCTDDRPKGRPKYWQVAGSGQVPFVVGEAGMPVVIVESALDAILIRQESENTVAAVAVMGASKDFDTDTREFIEQSSCIIACPDADEVGHKAWSRWRSQFPKARRVLPLNAKDLTDMHKLATMQLMRGEQRTATFLKEWLLVALKVARD